MRLRSEILFNLGIVMVFSMLLLSLMLLKFQRDSMEDQALEKHEEYTQMIKKTFSKLSVIGKKEAFSVLESLLSNIKTSDNGLDYGIYETTGGSFKKVSLKGGKGAEIVNSEFNSMFDLRDSKTNVNYSSGLFFLKRIESVKSYVPLFYRGDLIYVVCLYRGETLDEKGFKRVKLLVIAFTGIFAFIMIFFGYFVISRIVIKPLEKIAIQAKQIALGDLETKIDVEGNNEIKELTSSITTMTAKLLSNQSELKKNLNSLEKLNRDLAEAQMEIIRREKLASVGRLSSGVAHEIGNPLSAIIGYVGIMKSEADGEDLEMLTRAENELQRISKIIRQLLDFSRPVQVDLKETDVNKLVCNVIDDLKATNVLKNLNVEFDGDTSAERALIDSDQLHQILLNLIKNAADSIKEKFGENNGGEIKIDVKVATPKEMRGLESFYIYNKEKRKDDPPGEIPFRERIERRKEDPPKSKFFKRRMKGSFGFPRFLFGEDEELIKIEIQDNGDGIEKKDIEKIFDPFYTTKDPGAGTGLGLYMTLNSVDSMGGYVDVASNHKKGTVFLILLPTGGFC